MSEKVGEPLDVMKERTETIKALWELWKQLPFAFQKDVITGSEEVEIDYSGPQQHDAEHWRVHLEGEVVEHGPGQEVYRMMCRKGRVGIVYSVATRRYAQNLPEPAVFSSVFWASATIDEAGVWTASEGMILPLVTADGRHKIVPTEQQLNAEDISVQADKMDFPEIMRIISAVEEKLPKKHPVDEMARRRSSMGATASDDANRL